MPHVGDFIEDVPLHGAKLESLGKEGELKQMKKISKYIVFTSLVVFMAGCLSPSSKESYIEKFERFVDRVEQNHKKYNNKDWQWADSQFQKYNDDWYLKFGDEFTVSDQIKIKSLIIRYHSYKNKEDISELLKQLFKDDVDDAREKVEEYIENDMDEHIDILIEGTAAIGDSAVKVLEDVIKQLEESF